MHGRPALSDFEVLLPIRPAGTKLPLFCIHDAGGFSWPYSKLIRHIPAEHPIYGLQARNLTQRARRPRSIDEMAEDYVRLIRKIQPTGPYNLLGWSFGGLVAHAIATQLQATGEEVALLALLDSYPVQHDSARWRSTTTTNIVAAGRDQPDHEPARRAAPRGPVDPEGAPLRSHHGYVQEQHPADAGRSRRSGSAAAMSLFVATVSEAKPPVEMLAVAT